MTEQPPTETNASLPSPTSRLCDPPSQRPPSSPASLHPRTSLKPEVLPPRAPAFRTRVQLRAALPNAHDPPAHLFAAASSSPPRLRHHVDLLAHKSRPHPARSASCSPIPAAHARTHHPRLAPGTNHDAKGMSPTRPAPARLPGDQPAFSSPRSCSMTHVGDPDCDRRPPSRRPTGVPFSKLQRRHRTRSPTSATQVPLTGHRFLRPTLAGPTHHRKRSCYTPCLVAMVTPPQSQHPTRDTPLTAHPSAPGTNSPFDSTIPSASSSTSQPSRKPRMPAATTLEAAHAPTGHRAPE